MKHVSCFGETTPVNLTHNNKVYIKWSAREGISRSCEVVEERPVRLSLRLSLAPSDRLPKSEIIILKKNLDVGLLQWQGTMSE